MMLCGTVCRQLDMTAVAVLSRFATLQQLPTVAMVSANSVFCKTLLWGVVLGTAVLSILLLSSAKHFPDQEGRKAACNQCACVRTKLCMP